jgi:hypothetical protein
MHRAHRIAVVALTCLAVAAAPPASRADSVTLTWTAPGDDGMAGRATAYSLRYSTSPITAANFASATQVVGVPAPAMAGTSETFTVGGLLANTAYYFAIKARDEANNWSLISNVAVTTVGVTRVEGDPDAPQISVPWPNPARHLVSWSWALPAPGPVQLEVFGAGGRLVRSLVRAVRPAGRGEVTWDLRDQSGRRVAAGIYLVRALLGDQVWTQRLAVMR